MLTKQEIFNKVWERAKDPRRSVAPYSKRTGSKQICMYRPGGGLPPCFIGVCIPDSEYISTMETGIHQLACFGPWPPSLSREEADVDYYAALQRIHDDADPALWPEKLREVAERYSLTVPA